jgi:hypothetical protein
VVTQLFPVNACGSLYSNQATSVDVFPAHAGEIQQDSIDRDRQIPLLSHCRHY